MTLIRTIITCHVTVLGGTYVACTRFPLRPRPELKESITGSQPTRVHAP